MPIPIPALYFHIPFCGHVCPFCSFAVMKDNPVRHQSYLQGLQTEFGTLSQKYAFDFSALESVYLGGGTPSRLEISELQQLLAWIRTLVPAGQKVEWSMEVNPEDITDTYAKSMASQGITRVSVGAQSFHDRHLTRLNRQHTAQQARNALNRIYRAGIRNINLDLIFGFPGQTLDDLLSDIARAANLEITHLSLYSLTIESGTALHRKPEWRNWITEHESLIIEMYERSIEALLAHGFLHYEVSNFCRPPFASRQNMIYWTNQNYLGLGVGAHSHCHPYRWGNHKRLVDYQRSVTAKQPPQLIFETISPEMQRDEDLMLGLRLRSGLDLEAFQRRYHHQFSDRWHEKITVFREQGWLEKDSARLILTVKGLLLADEISAVLAASLD